MPCRLSELKQLASGTVIIGRKFDHASCVLAFGWAFSPDILRSELSFEASTWLIMLIEYVRLINGLEFRVLEATLAAAKGFGASTPESEKVRSQGWLRNETSKQDADEVYSNF